MGLRFVQLVWVRVAKKRFLIDYQSFKNPLLQKRWM
jgi:hypothetical protein